MFGKLLKYKRSVLILLIVWSVAALMFSGVAFVSVIGENRTISTWTVLSNSFVRVYLWGTLSPLIYLFAKRFPINPRKFGYRAISYNLLFGILLSFFYPWIYIAIAWLIDIDYFLRFDSFSKFMMAQIILLFGYTLISLYIPTFFTVQALLFFHNYKDEEANNSVLRTQLSDAKLNALKMQLNPHFLFNSLHSISSLILVNPSRANKMVALLGDFLRQTLEHSREQIVTLEEELEFLRCYLEIEETRFEDRLSVEFDISAKTIKAMVPHLILQPIVENAVKHGIAPFALPGKITISSKLAEQKLYLQIRDSGSKSNKNADEDVNNINGLGIENVRSRLEQLYGNEASFIISNLQSGGCEVNIIIPFKTDLEGNVQNP